MGDIDAEKCDTTHRFLHALLTGVLAVQEAEPAARHGVFQQARRKFGYVCLALAILLVGIGMWSVTGFVRTPANQVPWVEHD